MTNRSLMAALLLAGLSTTSAYAQSPKQEFDVETQRIAARYADDKKLCADENASNARMQCLRDAKSEYDKSMAQARDHYKMSPSAGCHDCGKVTSVATGEKAGESSALGLIAGGVAGALLGNQVGSGHGRQLATVAGAAGGAYAGKKVEEKAKATKVWTVHVRYDDGRQASFNFDHDPQMISGDHVRNDNGHLVRN